MELKSRIRFGSVVELKKQTVPSTAVLLYTATRRGNTAHTLTLEVDTALLAPSGTSSTTDSGPASTTPS